LGDAGLFGRAVVADRADVKKGFNHEDTKNTKVFTTKDLCPARILYV